MCLSCSGLSLHPLHDAGCIEGTHLVFVEWMNGLKIGNGAWHQRWGLGGNVKGWSYTGVRLRGTGMVTDAWFCHLLGWCRAGGIGWPPLFSRTSLAGMPYDFRRHWVCYACWSLLPHLIFIGFKNFIFSPLMWGKKLKFSLTLKNAFFLMAPGPQYTAQCWTHEDLLDGWMNL